MLFVCVFFVLARTETKMSLLLKSFFLPFLSGCFPLPYYKSKYLAKGLWGQCFVFNVVNVVTWQVLEIFSFQYCQSIPNFVFLGLRCQHWSHNLSPFNRNGAYVQEKKWAFHVKSLATITSTNSLLASIISKHSVSWMWHGAFLQKLSQVPHGSSLSFS